MHDLAFHLNNNHSCRIGWKLNQTEKWAKSLQSHLIKTHQLRSAFSKNRSTAIYIVVGGFSDQALCSWYIFELALRSWWIFVRRGRLGWFSQLLVWQPLEFARKTVKHALNTGHKCGECVDSSSTLA